MEVITDSLLPGFCKALEDEILEAKKKTSGYIINDGRILDQTSGAYLYVFTADGDFYIPDDSPVKVKVGQSSSEGIISSFDGQTLIIEIVDFIGEKVSQATLIAQPWYLLEELRNFLVQQLVKPRGDQYTFDLPMKTLGRVKARLDRYHDIVEEVVQQGSLVDLNPSQLDAASLIMGSEVAFVWGPPGTGKTTTLAFTIKALCTLGESVLVLANSNSAVDVLMAMVGDELKGTDILLSGRVVRYGTPMKEEVRSRNDITIDGILGREFPDLTRAIKECQQRRRDISKNIRDMEDRGERRSVPYHKAAGELRDCAQKLKPLREQKKELSKTLAQRAHVLGATLAKTFISPEIFERAWDAIIIDEASMAYIPYVFASACLANSRVAIVGDFRQLPPVSLAETEEALKWLHRDVFSEAGITQAIDEYGDDRRLAILRVQHRMHPVIREFVDSVAYGGRLEDAAGLEGQLNTFVAREPESGAALVIYNTSAVFSACYRDEATFSRFNPRSAALAICLAQSIMRNRVEKVVIITPYATQARLLQRMVRSLQLQTKIQASTIHRFQGSEATIVIWDLVDGRPLPHVGLLLDDTRNPDAKRLAIVALSRAQARCFILASVLYFRDKLAPTTTLHRLIKFASSRSLIRDPNRRGAIASGNEINWYSDNAEVLHQLRSDLISAKREISILWPTELESRQFPIQQLSFAAQRGAAVIVGGGTDVARNLVGKVQNLRSWLRERPVEPLCMIDRRICWFFKPSETEPHLGVTLRIEVPRAVELLSVLLRMTPSDSIGITQKDDFSKKGLGLSKCCNQPQWLRAERGTVWVFCASCGQRSYKADERIATAYAQIQYPTGCPVCHSQVIGKLNFENMRLYLTCSTRCGHLFEPLDMLL